MISHFCDLSPDDSQIDPVDIMSFGHNLLHAPASDSPIRLEFKTSGMIPTSIPPISIARRANVFRRDWQAVGTGGTCPDTVNRAENQSLIVDSILIDDDHNDQRSFSPRSMWSLRRAEPDSSNRLKVLQ